MKKLDTRAITEISVLITMLIVFNITIGRLLINPLAGNSFLTLEPLVLSLIAYKYNIKISLIAAFLYLGITSLLFGLFILPIDNLGLVFLDFLLEYPISSLAIIIPSLFKNKVNKDKKFYFVLGILLFGLYKFIIHGSAGVIFWREITITGDNNKSLLFAMIFSFLMYNIVYLIDAIICIFIGLTVYKTINEKIGDKNEFI